MRRVERAARRSLQPPLPVSGTLVKLRILVVDDDRHYGRLMSFRLEKNVDNDVTLCTSGEEALARLDPAPHLVLLDIMMPGIGGMETLRRLRALSPDTTVVMVSAQGVVEVAAEAIKLGAADYVTKGQDDLAKLDTIVARVRERVALEAEVENLRSAVQSRYTVEGLVGESAAMQTVYRLVDKALRGDLTVAVLGESGTGKELVARAIHYASARKRGPFVVVNCAAIPRDLMESEFFGHEKGSFTGAVARKIGKFEQADGGTIFLDEIGEMDLDLQAKLLRALQNREIVRVGGNQTLTFDARVISATNRDIPQMIRAGKFREDLYYRLFQYPIPIPPLREREGDLLPLADSFLKAYLSEHPEFIGKRLGAAAKRTILAYAWPGNVRELKSAVERSILISDNDEIQPDDLMLSDAGVISPWTERTLAEGPSASAVDEPSAPAAAPWRPAAAPPLPAASASFDGHAPDVEVDVEGAEEAAPEAAPDATASLEEMKQQAVLRAYRLAGGNVDRAAADLGIGRATMYRLLKKYGVMR